MYPSEERISHIAARLWRHLYHSQRELERFGEAELRTVLPVLFAMYHCAAGAVMRLSPEDLAGEEFITRPQAAEMRSLTARTAKEIAALLREENGAPSPNPIRALVKGTTRTLKQDRAEVNRALAADLTDFLVMSTVHRKGGPEHGAPHGEETP